MVQRSQPPPRKPDQMREKSGGGGEMPLSGNTFGNQAGAGGAGAAQSESDQGRQPPYNMHGVLHYIQHEWSRYEMERGKWDMERAELQARISFLQGERRGQENMKADLVRRIKMLEYCLKQERTKNYRLTHNGEEPPALDEEKGDGAEENGPDPSAPLDVDAYPLDGANALGWKQGRELLKQYLDEIGYSETILDVRSFRMKNLLGLVPPGQWPSNGRDGDLLQPPYRNAPPGGKDGSDSSSDQGAGADIDNDVNDALDEFDFLKKEPAKEDWHVSPEAIAQLKMKYKSEVQQKRLSSGSSKDDGESGGGAGEGYGRPPPGGGIPSLHPSTPASHASDDSSLSSLVSSSSSSGAKGGRRSGEYLDINDALGLPPDETAVDIKDVPGGDQDDDAAAAPQWAVRAVLRSHLDTIRAMLFHPVEAVLFTAGEDGTTKLWNLDAKPINAKDAEKANKNPSELEPVYTFRGHDGAVLTMDISPTGDRLFTGGLDGVICCWAVPSSNCDPYDVYDAKVLRERLAGHADAVWAVAYHNSDNRLVSASADGTIKLWEPGNFGEPLLRSFPPPQPDAVPTSVDFCSTEPQHLLAAYTKQQACIIDIETGATVLNFDFGEDASVDTRITRILSHPTMNTTIIGGSDRKIRYFDNSTGQQQHSAVAHVEAISSLAIDSNGLYLLSGSHDGSLRLWNMEKRTCLREIPAHRKKFDSAVTCVAIHSSKPLIGSAGADSLAKVYTTESRHV